MFTTLVPTSVILLLVVVVASACGSPTGEPAAQGSGRDDMPACERIAIAKSLGTAEPRRLRAGARFKVRVTSGTKRVGDSLVIVSQDCSQAFLSTDSPDLGLQVAPYRLGGSAWENLYPRRTFARGLLPADLSVGAYHVCSVPLRHCASIRVV